MKDFEITNHSSMLYWWPKIKDLPIPQPKTEIAYQKDDWWCHLDGIPIEREIITKVNEIANRFGYPVFVRTDLSSGKHNYLESCYIGDYESIHKNIWRLIETNAIKDLWFNSLIVREYLRLDWRFRAFNGLPIAPERRYFIEDGEVICHHPYWPENAIKFWGGSKNWEHTIWKEHLKRMNHESIEEIELLTGYTRLVSQNISGDWSVDFAKGANGTWYLIDMATAIQSWHPEH